MLIRLNEVRLLSFLRIADNLLIKVYPDKVVLIGEKSKNIISKYEEIGQFEVLEPEEYILNKEATRTLESFLKSFKSLGKKGRVVNNTMDTFENTQDVLNAMNTIDQNIVEFLIEESMPDITINKVYEFDGSFRNASVAVPIEFGENVFDDIEIDYEINSDNINVLNRDFIESAYRANTFVDYRSELKPAQYVKISIDEDENQISTLGFSGISGYEEIAFLQQEISMMSMSNTGINRELLIHSTIVNDVYRSRTILDKNNICISETKDGKYNVLYDNLYTLYIKKDEIKEIDFRKLFDQDFNISIKNIHTQAITMALSGVPNSGRADGVLKVFTNGASVLMGTDVAVFEIAKLSEPVNTGNLYFNSRDIKNYINNVKKTDATHVNLDLNVESKVLKFESFSSSGKSRFMVIGLNFEEDEEVFR